MRMTVGKVRLHREDKLFLYGKGSAWQRPHCPKRPVAIFTRYSNMMRRKILSNLKTVTSCDEAEAKYN